MSTTAGSVIQRYVPALAGTLALLKRSPGRSEAWSEGVWRALEESESEAFGRTRRRVGFARRLAELAELPIEEQAAATAGILFYELIQVEPVEARKTTTSRAWNDYLVRNVDWLLPAFHVVEALEASNWDTAETDAAITARVADVFDSETAGRHQRPLQILQSLIEAAPSPAVARIAPVLWSEYGQELCDKHFRRPDNYRLQPDDIKRSLEILKNGQSRKAAPAAAAAPTAEPTVAPMQWSGSKATRAPQPKSTRPSLSKRANPTDNNFERRRQALRSDLAASPRARQTEEFDEPVWDHEDEVAADEPPPREPEMKQEDTNDIDLELAASVLRRRKPDETPDHEDEPRSPTRGVSYPRSDRDASNVGEQLEDLRSKFEQIQRAAAAGERLLADLGPQLDELASWIADIETVIGRRRRGAGDRVA